MGIYIPNMEMPKDGQMLVIFPDGTAYVCFNGMRERLAQAEAVSVQPHGRLGDLDKQDKQIEALIERHLHGYTKSTWDFVCQLRDILKRNRTIIPAELSVLHGTFAAASEQEALKRITTAEEGKT